MVQIDEEERQQAEAAADAAAAEVCMLSGSKWMRLWRSWCTKYSSCWNHWIFVLPTYHKHVFLVDCVCSTGFGGCLQAMKQDMNAEEDRSCLRGVREE